MDLINPVNPNTMILTKSAFVLLIKKNQGHSSDMMVIYNHYCKTASNEPTVSCQNCEICSDTTFYTKPPPTLSNRHVLVNSKKRKRKSPSLLVQCEHHGLNVTFKKRESNAQRVHSLMVVIQDYQAKDILIWAHRVEPATFQSEVIPSIVVPEPQSVM